LAQMRMVEEALARASPSLEIATEIIRTRGDHELVIPGENASPARTEGYRREIFKVTSTGSLDFARDDPTAGRKGIFTAELESALTEKRIDVAVHSAKDLPSEIRGGLTITAVLPRGAIEDLLLRKSVARTPIVTIATGSVRRERQARWINPAVRIVGLRGNVPTRLRKFIESDWDAIILARAGLERLGFCPPEFEFEKQRLFAEILALENFLPAGGQGVVALQTRAADLPTRKIVSSIDDQKTHLCLRAEREFLRLLQGDCDLPVGVHARFVDGEMELRTQVFGDAVAPETASGRGNNPEKLAAEVFWKIEHE
jgi:hydroxymethylbilane synthase